MSDNKKFLDQEGIKYLWSQLSLEDYPNNEVLMAVLQAIDDTKADRTEVTTREEIQAYCNESVYGIIDGNIENISNNKVDYIRDYMFYQHQNLKNAEFPIATSIGNYSFYTCPALMQVNVPEATKIGQFAFRNCTNLTTINYPLVTEIGQGAFDGCQILESINTLNITTVEPLTFRYCENLTTIELNNVNVIKSQAFYNCGVTSLILKGSEVCTLENKDAFYFTPIEEGSGYIYVPASLVDSYKTADNWSIYANQIVAIV